MTRSHCKLNHWQVVLVSILGSLFVPWIAMLWLGGMGDINLSYANCFGINQAISWSMSLPLFWTRMYIQNRMP